MTSKLHISIKRRIYLSFSLLVCLFILNGILTNNTLADNKRLYDRLSNVVDPSLEKLDDLKKMLLESKMYTTNWVFLRYKQEDKSQLKKLHDQDYAALKMRMVNYSSGWTNKPWMDSLNTLFVHFEELMQIEKQIMGSLQSFTDYDDPVLKLDAERKVEDDILPRTDALMSSLNRIENWALTVRIAEHDAIEKSSFRLKVFITALGLAMILAGFLLSIYLTRVIIAPVQKISRIINDLGKGVLRKIKHSGNSDEIGSIINSVNNLSDSLQSTASFAYEVGLANFDMPFQPLSEEDTLGKSLIMMRQNLKTGKENLEVQNRELEKKNKELEQFAYVASHDLQEPLQTTLSFVELMQKQYKGRLDEKADKYLEYIGQASARMKVLITDLLEFSRIGNKNEIRQVDCNMVLQEVTNDLKEGICTTGTKIEAEILPVIRGHKAEIKQLFQHLISNAIKFRKEGVAPQLKILVEKKKDNWQFAFTDNGIGIAKENFERIFIIFQRLHTRSQYNGSGIGLSHCKKIVEIHKGKIWLESEPGKGTTFYFTISQNIHSI
jgi:signal transduction histidine kinase